MTKAEIEDAIREAISNSANEEGWANLAELGVHLRKQGIKYGKLSHFFKDYTHIVETRVDLSIMPPVAYARLLQTEASQS